MAHSILAFVGRSGMFDRPWLTCPAAAAPLAQNMRLVALTHELWENIYAHTDASQSPRHASMRASNWRKAELAFLARLSAGGAAAFIDTNYFGGDGNQGAIAARDGSIVFGPRTAPSGVVNQALRLLGVTCQKDDFDEFDALGLGRFRDNAKIIRAYLQSNWLRAWFVLPESYLSKLEEMADLQPKSSILRASSGLYSCPRPPSGDNPVEEFLMEKCSSMHAFELSQERLWWMNDFFLNTRGVALLPQKTHPFADRMEEKTDIRLVMWTASQAQAAIAALAPDVNARSEFAGFRSPIYHTSPPRELTKGFRAAAEFLRSFFGEIELGSVGVLVDL